jgi:hypothetical protein
MLFAIDEVEELGDRLYESLSLTDITRLETDLQTLGEASWEQWSKENEAVALEILSRRGEPLHGFKDVERRRLTWLLIEKLKKAAALLNTDFMPVTQAKDVRALVAASSNIVERLEKSCRR